MLKKAISLNLICMLLLGVFVFPVTSYATTYTTYTTTAESPLTGIFIPTAAPGDSTTATEIKDGTTCWYVDTASKYLYYYLHKDIMGAADGVKDCVRLDVEYYDNSTKNLSFTYYSVDDAGNNTSHTPFVIPRTGTNTFKTVSIFIYDADWRGWQIGKNNTTCSFRIGTADSSNPAYIKGITLTPHAMTESANLAIDLNGVSALTVDKEVTAKAVGFSPVQYTWLRSLQDASGNTVTGAYIADVDQTGANYAVTHEDEGKSLRVLAKAQDGTVYSSAATSAMAASTISSTTGKASDGLCQAGTPIENVFMVGEKSFILLDVKESDRSKFLVMTKDYYGKRAFDTTSNKFDVNNTDNIAYYLNNGFLSEEDTLPESIQSHIKPYWWRTEATRYNGKSYTTRARIALLSAWEFDKYVSKIGYSDGKLTDGSFAWMRSPFVSQYVSVGMSFSTSTICIMLMLPVNTGFVPYSIWTEISLQMLKLIFLRQGKMLLKQLKTSMI